VTSGSFIINSTLMMKVLDLWIETQKPKKTLSFKFKVSVTFIKLAREDIVYKCALCICFS